MSDRDLGFKELRRIRFGPTPPLGLQQPEVPGVLEVGDSRAREAAERTMQVVRRAMQLEE